MVFYSFSNVNKIFWASFYNKCAGFFSKWWGKYLSTRSQIKRTCSWCEKLFVLWTLNRQAKTFLSTVYGIMKISWKHHTGGWGKNISRKNLQDQDGKELFCKTKKKIYRNIKSPCLANCLVNLFLQLLQRQKYQIAVFFVVPIIVETAMEALPLLVIYLFN